MGCDSPMKKNIIKGLIIVILLLCLILLYPIARLAITNDVIVKSLISDTYFAKISSDEYDFNVFVEYMKIDGWIENESKRMGGLHVFEKDGDKKSILNTDVKTVFIDGRLNIAKIQSFLN